MDLPDDTQWEAQHGRRGKFGTVQAGNSARVNNNDNSVALGEALEWAAGALAKIQVRVLSVPASSRFPYVVRTGGESVAAVTVVVI